MRFVLAFTKPTFKSNGDAPLRQQVQNAQIKGKLKHQHEQHLWYDVYMLHLDDN